MVTSSSKRLSPPRNELIASARELTGADPSGPSIYETEVSDELRKEHMKWANMLAKGRNGRRPPSSSKISDATSSKPASSSKRSAASRQPAQPQDDDFTCPVCNKSFKNKGAIRQHTLQVHIGTKCYWPGCSVTTESEPELNAHLKEHNDDPSPDGRYKCTWPGCDKTYAFADSLTRHARQHNSEAREAAEN
ncbi:hypothetical protein F5Y13DRAFT_205534 [Hypoxylon sp. FL1857]|nr:hypothetical protein F5Y13DRAFT_205534 [Hypoxylon sp. FL1857]